MLLPLPIDLWSDCEVMDDCISDDRALVCSGELLWARARVLRGASVSVGPCVCSTGRKEAGANVIGCVFLEDFLFDI